MMPNTTSKIIKNRIEIINMKYEHFRLPFPVLFCYWGLTFPYIHKQEDEISSAGRLILEINKKKLSLTNQKVN